MHGVYVAVDVFVCAAVVSIQATRQASMLGIAGSTPASRVWEARMDSNEVDVSTRDAEKEKALSLMDNAFLYIAIDVFCADVLSVRNEQEPLCDVF